MNRRLKSIKEEGAYLKFNFTSRFLWLLGLLSLIFCLAEGYFYYKGTGVLEGILLNLYNAIKTFAFSSSISLKDASEVVAKGNVGAYMWIIYYGYLIAVFIAPFCTATAILYTLLHTALNLLHKGYLFSDCVYVFGYNSDAKDFINDVLTTSRKKVVLVVKETINKQEKMQLLRKKIYIHEFDYLSRNHEEICWSMRKIKLVKAESIILFEQKAIDNFELFVSLTKCIKKKSKSNRKPIPCCIHCDSTDVKRIISIYYDDYVKNSAAQNETPLDLKIFNLQEIAAQEMFHRAPLHTTNVLNLKQLGQNPLDGHCWDVNMLIVGFGRYGQRVLEQTIQQGALHRDNRIQIEVFDKNATEALYSYAKGLSNKEFVIGDNGNNKYISLNKEYRDGSLQINFYDTDVTKIDFENKLKSLKGLTYAAVCIKDPGVSIQCIRDIKKFNDEMPIAVRLDMSEKVLRYITEDTGDYQYAFTYGFNKHILTYKYIVQEHLDKGAHRRNYIYSVSSSMSSEKWQTGDEEEWMDSWSKLSISKRDSNRQLVLHDSSKLLLIWIFQEQMQKSEHLYENLGNFMYMTYDYFSSLKKDLDDIEKKRLYSRYKEAVRKFLDEFIINNKNGQVSKMMEDLCAMEHKRWYLTQCLNGYCYGEVKEDSLTRRTNPCMMDWDSLIKKMPQMVKYDRYNVILSIEAILSLDDEEIRNRISKAMSIELECER